MTWFTWSTCWCDWPREQAFPGRTHDEHAALYGYPDHEPSTTWNLPEPTEGAAA